MRLAGRALPIRYYIVNRVKGELERRVSNSFIKK
jgi:hypothetical protein